MAKSIKKRKGATSGINGVKIAFDVEMLDALIKYVRCEFVGAPQISTLYDLLKKLNYSSYAYNQDILDRLNLLRVTCEAMCEKHIRDESILISYLRENLDDFEDIVKNVVFDKNLLSISETETIGEFISERLQYIYIYEIKDEIIDELSSLDKPGFISYAKSLKILKEKLSRLMVQLQNAGASEGMIRSFNFSGDQYMKLLSSIVEKSKKPSTILQTGIRQLNAILSPGFQSGGFYIFLGGTGRFKSGTLWNIADQLRRYNPQINPVEDGMRKVILFVTLENTIYETILRLFDMYNPTAKEISEMEVEEVANILRTEGKFIFTDEDGIDIEMRYFDDMEITTADLYGLIHDLADQGKEVIALILDYILKMNSVKDHYGDERLRLSYVGRELRGLGQFFDIPVISAMQYNREGNGILDAAMQENKEDIGRFVGMSYVGQCWDLMQEATWVCGINLEMQKSSGKWFLSFKRIKIRGKKDLTGVDYFNHPFANNNGIRLEVDIDKPNSVSVISLASDLINIDDPVPEAKGTARKRPRVQNRTGNIVNDIELEGLIKCA